MLFIAISLLIVVVIVATVRLTRLGVRILASIDDLNAAIAAEAASIEALATAIGNATTPIDLQPSVDAVNANRSRIDGLTTALGGNPPPTP